jgi:hypothetical protein
MFSDSSRKSCRLWENVKKYGGAREVADNIAPVRDILDKYAYTPALLQPHPPNHTKTHTHTEICNT